MIQRSEITKQEQQTKSQCHKKIFLVVFYKPKKITLSIDFFCGLKDELVRLMGDASRSKSP